MSDEIKTVEVTEHKCLCQSKGFRKFLINTAATFLGVFLALSLFAAMHKPPVIMPMGPGMYGGMRGCPCHHFMNGHANRFEKFDKDDFQRHRFEKRAPKDINRPAPFEAQRPEVDD